MAEIVHDTIVLQSPSGNFRVHISLTDSGSLIATAYQPDRNGGWKSEPQQEKTLARWKDDISHGWLLVS
jgi:hypothetical protein